MKDYVPLIQTAIWALFALIVLFIFRRPLLERIKAGSSIKFGIFELGEKVNQIEQRVATLADRVSTLFLLTMAPEMYLNLKKFSSRHFGIYQMNDGLKREMYHLRNLGYLAIDSITAIPPEGPNLSDYVEITSTGQQFVELREEINSRAQL